MTLVWDEKAEHGLRLTLLDLNDDEKNTLTDNTAKMFNNCATFHETDPDGAYVRNITRTTHIYKLLNRMFPGDNTISVCHETNSSEGGRYLMAIGYQKNFEVSNTRIIKFIP